MFIPKHLKYTAEHEWLGIKGDEAAVGITAFAVESLGDVVFLELPGVGAILNAGEACGEIESTKSVSDLFAPADGEVTAINEELVEEPGVLNIDPYQRGWLFRMRITQAPDLMDAVAYEQLTRG